MPRLFTGLEIPADIGMRLSLLSGGLRNARWIERGDYHITLRFIGDIEDRLADEVADALGRIHRDPIEIRLGGLDAFGKDKPHSIFARVEPTPELAELQAEQERIIQRLGLPAERRKFTPHMTLCACAAAQARMKWHAGFPCMEISRPRPSRQAVSCCFLRKPPPAAAPISSRKPIRWRPEAACAYSAGRGFDAEVGPMARMTAFGTWKSR